MDRYDLTITHSFYVYKAVGFNLIGSSTSEPPVETDPEPCSWKWSVIRQKTNWPYDCKL